MTQHSKTLAKAIIISVLAVNASSQAKPSTMDPNNITTANIKMESCFGISKKHMNDCGNDSHACAGEQIVDNSPTNSIMVLKGNCKRIVGGMLTQGCARGCTPMKTKKKKTS
ncbi:MAG: DUF2282 domain-containing protein [Gammaproteobacteria bacterium]|nr:DUF2282 domain-containing protein [Gammaproteobacteria bacterium]MCH9744661.1 DUF2282 domain-containing protein [Gammaproteobacteria bacterium]